MAEVVAAYVDMQADVLNELAEAVKDSKKIVREYAKEKNK